MDSFIELSYVNLILPKLVNHKITSHRPFKVNFRCPYCGDSKKSESKRRGWIYQYSGLFFFNCFNCGLSCPFSKFLEEQDPSLYSNYRLEKYREKQANESPLKIQKERKQIVTTGVSSKNVGLKKISSLKPSHVAHKYVTSRKIPSNQHWRMYYAPRFVELTNSIIPGKLSSKEHARLVFPFLNEKGNKMLGYAGRSLSNEGGNTSVRYVTIMFDEESPKIFGLDRYDSTKTYFITEGAIDSLFLSNAIAMAGSSIRTDYCTNIENAVFVFDNEPRNREIHNRMRRIIDDGYRCCIWPSGVVEKDINDMVLSGKSPKDIESLILDRAFVGLKAKVELVKWKKT